jgi:hypothetical protein
MKRAHGRIGHFATATTLPALLALAGCGSSKPAPTTQATVPTSTISATASYAVPNRITTAYVQRVLNVLERLNSAAGADIVDNGRLTNVAVSDLKAIFAPDLFAAQVNLWVNDITSGLKGFRHPSGLVVDHVTNIFSADSSCVFVGVIRDVSAVTLTPPPPHTTYVQLVPAHVAIDPGHLNPTPWAFEMLGPSTNNDRPANPCAAS